jgi:predicted Zn-dependent protease
MSQGMVLAEEILAALARRGCREAEVYLKRGRSRCVALGVAGVEVANCLEEGWAVRASDRRRSWFAAGSGPARPLGEWPAGDSPPLRLVDPQPVAPWTAPAELGAPLLGEGEALALLETIGRGIAAEVPGARLVAARLEDGASESDLASSRGVRAACRHRLAALRLEVVLPGGRGGIVADLGEREARRFRPQALSRRLVDRLLVARDGRPPAHDGGEIVLAPGLAARLVEATAPWLCGPDAEGALAPLRDGAGRIAAGCVTLTDDGRRPGGILAAAVDGEGSPTALVTLVEEGVFRQPLLAWWEARPPQRASGCVRRASFRDLPRRAPTHLVLEPNPRLTPGELVAGVERGFYLLDLEGAPVVDLAGDTLAVPVCGFALAGGRAAAPVRGAVLTGSARRLWAGAVAVARDLEWVLGDGAYGAPTVLLSGLEVRRAVP